MKKTLSILGILLFLSTNAKAETIRMVADQWCPYNCGVNDPRQGYIVDIARKIFAKYNIDIQYENVSWVRALEKTRLGEYDAAIGASITEGKGMIFPKEDMGLMRVHFFVKKGNTWRYNGIASLENKILGVITDYDYTDDLNAYIAKNQNNLQKVQAVNGDDALKMNLRKLDAGRIDIMPEDAFVMQYRVMSDKLEDKFDDAGVANPQLSIPNDGIFIAFSPKNPRSKEWAKILSDGITQMRRSGELQKILSSYGLKDWQS